MRSASISGAAWDVRLSIPVAREIIERLRYASTCIEGAAHAGERKEVARCLAMAAEEIRVALALLRDNVG